MPSTVRPTVDLPDPLSPISPSDSPRLISKDTPSMAHAKKSRFAGSLVLRPLDDRAESIQPFVSATSALMPADEPFGGSVPGLW